MHIDLSLKLKQMTQRQRNIRKNERQQQQSHTSHRQVPNMKIATNVVQILQHNKDMGKKKKKREKEKKKEHRTESAVCLD